MFESQPISLTGFPKNSVIDALKSNLHGKIWHLAELLAAWAATGKLLYRYPLAIGGATCIWGRIGQLASKRQRSGSFPLDVPARG